MPPPPPTYYDVIASLAHGHAYNQHAQEFSNSSFGPTTTINSNDDLARHIQDIINHPDTKAVYNTQDKRVLIYNETLNAIIQLNSGVKHGDAGTIFRVSNPDALTQLQGDPNKKVTRFNSKITTLIDEFKGENFKSRNPTDVKAMVGTFAQEHNFSSNAISQIGRTQVAATATTLQTSGTAPTLQEITDFDNFRQSERARIARPGLLMGEIRDVARAGAQITDNGNVRTIKPHDATKPTYEITTTRSGATIEVITSTGRESVPLTTTESTNLTAQVTEHRIKGIRERLDSAMKATDVSILADEKTVVIEANGGKESYSITKNNDGTLRIDVSSHTGSTTQTDSIDLPKSHSKDLAKAFRSSSALSGFSELRKFATSIVLAVGISVGGANTADAKVKLPETIIVEPRSTRKETPDIEESKSGSRNTGKPNPPEAVIIPPQKSVRNNTTIGSNATGTVETTRPLTTGSGGDIPRTTSSNGVDGEVTNRSRWQQAVADVGGAKGVAAHVVGKAGYGLSAFHLSQQLFGENSTLKSDLKNDQVRTKAITAVTLDAAVFATDTIEFGADVAKYAKYLRNVDKLDDLARIASTTSKISKFSKVAGPVGTAVTIVTTGLQYSIAETLEDGRRAAEAVGGGAGGLGGAGVGAGIGVWFGGPVGAGVGAIIGGLIGGFGGAKVAEHYWSDDFQEHFDEKALQRQKENLEKLKGLGDDLEKFIKLEQDTVNAHKHLVELYDKTDTRNMNHKQVLEIDANKIKEIDNALLAYQTARKDLAKQIDASMLSTADKQTLDNVMQFIQERKAFLVAKEKHLTETGDNDALKRLADDRKGLQEAEQTILRWKGLNEAIAEQYGTSSQEGLRKAEQEIEPTTKAVADRKAHIADYQDKIRKHDAAVEQQTFEKTFTQKLDKVNKIYNSGQTDDALMQRSAALLSLVESGQMDQKTLEEASSEIGKLKSQHAKDLADMNKLKTGFLVMSKNEQAHLSDSYKKIYAGHNLANLKAANLRMTEITDSYKVSQDIASHTLKAAESASAIRTIVDSGVSITGETATKVSGHIVNIAGHTADTLALLNKDLNSTSQTLHGEWNKLQSREVINISRYLELRDQSLRLVEATDGKVAEIDRYQQTLRDTLENGYKQGEQRIPLNDEYARKRMQEVIDRLEKLKVQYMEQSNKILYDVEKAGEDVNKRVLQRGDTTITLDRKGMVATYTVGNKTITFGTDRRPLLVDENANIYNSAASLKNAPVNFYLYRGGIVTKIGEPFQGYKKQDTDQLKTIEDTDERNRVQSLEQDLTKKLQGKSIKNAVSEIPTAPKQETQPSVKEATPQASIEPTQEALEDDEASQQIAMDDIDNEPDFIEGAIALEKMEAGETLDAMEKAALTRILKSPDANPDIIAALTSRYSDTIKTLQNAESGQTGEGQSLSPQPYIAKNQSAYLSRAA